MVAGVAAFGIASALLVGTAGADPSKGDTVPLVCDNGKAYTVVVNGNGEFTPAHDLNSNTVFVPVSFGSTTITAVLPDGTVMTFTEPGSSKGQSAKGLKNPVTCTFTFSFTSDGSDPNGPPAGTVVTGTGTVVVRVA
jgi:hypothetical protein